MILHFSSFVVCRQRAVEGADMGDAAATGGCHGSMHISLLLQPTGAGHLGGVAGIPDRGRQLHLCMGCLPHLRGCQSL